MKVDRIQPDAKLSSIRTISESNDQNQKEIVQHQEMRRDCWILFIFIIFAILWVILTIVAFVIGDTSIIMSPMNNSNSIDSCRSKYKKPGQNFLLYSGIINWQTYCLKQCPKESNTTAMTLMLGGILQSKDFTNLYINQKLSYSWPYYERKVISYPVINRLCIPHIDYFKQIKDQSYNQLQETSKMIIKNIKSQPIPSNFYLDFTNNWYFILIFFAVSFIFSSIICKLMVKHFTDILKLSKIIIHVGLIGQALLFMCNSGTLKISRFNSPYLGIPRFQYSAHNFNYAILFLVLQGLWIITHIYLYRSQQIADSATNLSFQLAQKSNIQKKYSTILSFCIGVMIIVALWASAHFYSTDISINNNNYNDTKNYFGHSYYWSLIHIAYLISASYLILFFIEINTIIYKCLYFQNISSLQPKRQFLSKIKYHSGRFALHVLSYPLKPLIRFIYVIRRLIEDCFKLQYESKCIKTNIKTISFFIYYMFNTNGYLQQYITRQGIYESQLNSLDFHMKYFEQYKLFKRGKLQFNCIRYALTLITALHFHIIITFALQVKKDFVYPQYQLLLCLIIAYIVSGVNLAYYSSTIDSSFYAYHYFRKSQSTYALKNDANKKLLQKAMLDMRRQPIKLQQQQKQQKQVSL